MSSTLIRQATIVNEGKRFIGDLLIEDDVIKSISSTPISTNTDVQVVNAQGLYLLPGLIDAHVHFREPGLTQKGDIHSESRAALAGGVTYFMDMPNVKPQTTSLELLEQKKEIAQRESIINSAFYLGLTNDNIDDILNIDPNQYCAIKLFLGSSTGNMLVNNPERLEYLFANAADRLIAVHSEDESIIQFNRERLIRQYGEGNIPIAEHPNLRSREACIKATQQIVALANKYGTRLHILHITTQEELDIIRPYSNITAETCPHYLFFNDQDYAKFGARIKCNPAIKTAKDQEALIEGLMNGAIQTIGTDHAPHLLSDKEGDCLKAASGAPQIQFSILVLLNLVKQGKLTLEKIVELTAHNPANIYRIKQRGFIRENYKADLTLIDINKPLSVTQDTILSKCGWSPYEGITFPHSVAMTFVNGVLRYKDGTILE